MVDEDHPYPRRARDAGRRVNAFDRLQAVRLDLRLRLEDRRGCGIAQVVGDAGVDLVVVQVADLVGDGVSGARVRLDDGRGPLVIDRKSVV